VIRAGFDQAPDRVGNRRIGGLLQGRKPGLAVVHAATPEEIMQASPRGVLNAV
jgi:hypothetical protein